MFDNSIKTRVRAFPGATGALRAEKVGRWLLAILGNESSVKWCIENGIALSKASAEGVDTLGGFLAPQDFDDAVIAVREKVGAFRQGADVRPAKSDNQVRPRRVGGLTASFVGEGAAIPESSFLLAAVETSPKKMAVLARSSTELLEDDPADLGEFLTTEVAYAFAALEDDCGFNGDGTSAFGGVSGLATRLTGLKSSIAAASGHNTFSTVDTTDLGNLISAVMGVALSGAAWYVNPIVFGASFCRLAGGGGGGYLETRVINGVTTPYYLGFPVRLSAKLPDGSSSLVGRPMLFFGDLSRSSMLVERRQIMVGASLHAALGNDQVLFRGTQRLDLVNHTVGDATTRGPVAMLVGTA